MATTLNDIYQCLNAEFKGVCKDIFPQDRPRSVKDSMNEFLVVGIAAPLVNREIGKVEDYNMQITTIQVEVFVRDIMTASNPKNLKVQRMSELVDLVCAKFPITDNARSISITRPNILAPMYDGNGFHYTIIQANLKTI